MAITHQKKEYPDKEILENLHPFVKEWFTKKFEGFSPPQKYAIRNIQLGKNSLISSPTGSGKCVTPDTTILIEKDGFARLVTGNELIDMTKGTPLVASIEETGALHFVQGLKSHSFNGNFTERQDAMVFHEEYNGEIIRIKTRYGREVKVSPEHPLLVETDDGFSWVPAREIQPGDKVGVPRRVELPEKQIILPVEQAIASIRKSAKFVVNYEDFQRLKHKTRNFTVFNLSTEEYYQLQLLSGFTMETLAQEAGIGLATTHRLFNHRTSFGSNLVHSIFKRISGTEFAQNQIMVQGHSGVCTDFMFPTEVDERVSRWVAFVTAEGFIGEYECGATIHISQKNRKSMLQTFLKETKELFNLEFVQKNEKDFAIQSTYAALFISALLDINTGKGRYVDLPDWLLNCSKKSKKEFLRVFFSLEAEAQHNYIKLAQASQQKIEILNYLLLSRGIFASLGSSEKFASNTEAKIKRTYHTITIHGIANLRKMIELCIEHPAIPQITQYCKGAPSGKTICKHRFDYKKIGKLAEQFPNRPSFEKELGTAYEVSRRTGYITEDAINKVIPHTHNSQLFLELTQKTAQNLMWLEVLEKETQMYEGMLVDLSVPELENFVGGHGGMYLHNTLSAFLAIINNLVTHADLGTLEERVYCIYISPLKALANDINKNLTEPLKEISEIAKKYNRELKIRVGTRTGDTPPSQKARMLKKPPHILITTPESMAIMLTTMKFSEMLKKTSFVIIDEIHAIAENKRGTHLSLSLERLARNAKFTRVGLSATVAPLEEVAKFLVGLEDPDNDKFRDCQIIDVNKIGKNSDKEWTKRLDMKVISPVKDIMNASHTEMQDKMYSQIHNLIQEHRSTLIFTNTRAATERVVHQMKARYPRDYANILDVDEEQDKLQKAEGFQHEHLDEEAEIYKISDEAKKEEDSKSLIGAHHGSLAKAHRLKIEDHLKEGKLRCVVCFDGETEILLADGTWKAIKDIKDSTVQAIDNNLKLTKRDIVKKHKTKNSKKLLKITTDLGKSVKCTPNHKFMVLKNGHVVWKAASNLIPGEFVATSRTQKYTPLKSAELEALAFSSYPNSAILFLRSAFLTFLKSKISEIKSIKKFYARLKIHISYNTFIQGLNGNYGMRLGVVRAITQALNISSEVLFENISSISSTKYRMPPLQISEKLMRLLGFMAAEGYLSERDLFVSNKDEELLSYYSRLILELSGKPPTRKLSSTGTPILMWTSGILCKFLRKLGFPYGRKARTQRLPPWIFRLPPAYAREFIAGYYDGDGYLEKKSERVYSAGLCTTSIKLATDFVKLLARENILSSLRTQYYDEIQIYKGREIKKKGNFHTVSVLGGQNLREFAHFPIKKNKKTLMTVLKTKGHCNKDVIPDIGSNLKEERARIGISTYQMQRELSNPMKYERGERNITRLQCKQILSKYHSQKDNLLNLCDSDLFWDRIKNIETARASRHVYNIEVSTEHNYVANGFVVKNCSTSLELGIDIGFIDLVILLGSPKSVARALQRIGRSGHKLHAEAKGRIIVLDRDDLVECSMILKAAMDRKIDRISMPRAPLDVLAQQLYGIAIEEITEVETAWRLVKSAYPYNTLTREDFDKTMDYLSGKHTQLEERHIYAKIWIDEGKFGKRGKLARLIYMTNVGTIPDQTAIVVKIKEAVIGTITEEFVERLKPGDVFVLGGEPYEFRFSRGMTAQVRTSAGKMPTVPSWISEMLPLNHDLAMEIQSFRKYMDQQFSRKAKKEKIIEWMSEYLYNDENSIESIYRYFREQYKFSTIPHRNKILMEYFKDGNKRYVFVHTLVGRRTNDVLARALAYTNGRITGRDVEIGITDNGFYLKSTVPIQAKRALSLVKAKELDKLMAVALNKSEVMRARFRHCATRSLMILRRYKGEAKSVGKQQISSQIIMNAVKKLDPDFPILKETRREILEDLMDIKHARELIEEVNKKKIKVEEATTDIPSPFAFNMVLQGYVDILKMEDRVEFVRRLHKMVLSEIDAPKGKKLEMPAPEITYDRLWEAQEREERLKREDYQAYLQEQMIYAARRAKLDPDIVFQLGRLVSGEQGSYPGKFRHWLTELLAGTIPKYWKDDLVKFLKEKEKKI
ncbi:DEAD/DEAH box helicase [Candidatus Woesearchaeota archaeon]|nr:DEAD/DEAH box helicase [Candidatus Woesearchaeota archaeon]